MHHLHMVNITVREDHLLYPMVFDDFWKLILGKDGYPFWIEGSGKLRWIMPILNTRNLSGGKCHDIDGWIISIADMKIVEIPSRSPHD